MAIENRSQKEIRASYKGKSFSEVFPKGLTAEQAKARAEQLLADTQAQIATHDGFVTLLSKYATAVQLAEVALETGTSPNPSDQATYQQAGQQFLALLGFLKKHGLFRELLEMAMSDAIDLATKAAAAGDPRAKAALHEFNHHIENVVDEEARAGNPVAQALQKEMGKGVSFMGVKLGGNR